MIVWWNRTKHGGCSQLCQWNCRPCQSGSLLFRGRLSHTEICREASLARNFTSIPVLMEEFAVLRKCLLCHFVDALCRNHYLFLRWHLMWMVNEFLRQYFYAADLIRILSKSILHAEIYSLLQNMSDCVDHRLISNDVCFLSVLSVAVVCRLKGLVLFACFAATKVFDWSVWHCCHRRTGTCMIIITFLRREVMK